MSQENLIPEWAKVLGEVMASTIEFKGPAYMEWQHSTPEESEYGVDLIELWPAMMEIEEAGPNDGEVVFGVVHSFDILSAQEIFDEVDAVTFGFENDGQPNLSIEGKYQGRDVVVLVYFEPVFDADDGEEDEFE
jgi:hypothetical protein